MNTNSFSQTGLWHNQPNPLAERVPYFHDLAELINAIAFNPLNGIDVSALSFMEIDELLVGEKTPLAPTFPIIRAVSTWHSMLHAGLRNRNPLMPEARRRYWDALAASQTERPIQAPTSGISIHVLKGASGMGKSVTMRRFCRLFPQTIRHEKNDAAGWNSMLQLVYLEVSISHDGTCGGFLLNILTSMDAVLGTSYATDLPRQYRTVEKLSVATISRLIAHYTGLLILEEGQIRNLLLSRHAADIQGFLLALMNSGVPTVFIGNECAFDWITYSQDLTRLYSTPTEHFVPIGAIATSPADIEDALADWDSVSNCILDYYLLPEPPLDLEGCKRELLACCGGIPRVGLFLWCQTQRRALLNHRKSIGPLDLRAFHESECFNVYRPLADGFALKIPDLLIGIEDVDHHFYMKHWGMTCPSNTNDPPGAHEENATSTPEDEPAKGKNGKQVSEKQKYASEKTKKINAAAKREAILKNIGTDDIRRAGLIHLHLAARQEASKAGSPSGPSAS